LRRRGMVEDADRVLLEPEGAWKRAAEMPWRTGSAAVGKGTVIGRREPRMLVESGSLSA
jgi:hypothetical protein